MTGLIFGAKHQDTRSFVHSCHYMKHLGVIMGQLSTLRFDKIGSLFEHGSTDYVVGECLSPSLTWQERDSLDGVERGPFLDESQYLKSLIDVFISHATELPLTPHAFFAPIPDYSEYPNWSSYRAAIGRWNDYVAIGAKIESSKNLLSYCLAGQMLHQMSARLSTPDGSYTLSHPDLHLGNMFVDDEFNITCLIDWGSATSGPITELQATPGLGNSAFPPPEQLVSAFRAGFSQEHPLPAESWERADMMWHFSRLVRLLSTQDYRLFQALYKLVYKTDAEDSHICAVFNEMAAEEGNQRLLATLRADDYTASELEQQEAKAFGCCKTDKGNGRAVARKLTVVAEMNKTFLASAKVWRWIEKSLENDT